MKKPSCADAMLAVAVRPSAETDGIATDGATDGAGAVVVTDLATRTDRNKFNFFDKN